MDASASSAGPPPTWVREGDAAAYALLAANFPQLVQVRGGVHSAACLDDPAALEPTFSSSSPFPYTLPPYPPPLQACELHDAGLWASWAAGGAKAGDVTLLPPRISGKVRGGQQEGRGRGGQQEGMGRGREGGKSARPSRSNSAEDLRSIAASPAPPLPSPPRSPPSRHCWSSSQYSPTGCRPHAVRTCAQLSTSSPWHRQLQGSRWGEEGRAGGGAMSREACSKGQWRRGRRP